MSHDLAIGRMQDLRIREIDLKHKDYWEVRRRICICEGLDLDRHRGRGVIHQTVSVGG